jgi:hypothetical protein
MRIALTVLLLQPLIDNDRATWQALSNGGEKIDEACETCHQTYWYPNEPKPPAE